MSVSQLGMWFNQQMEVEGSKVRLDYKAHWKEEAFEIVIEDPYIKDGKGEEGLLNEAFYEGLEELFEHEGYEVEYDDRKEVVYLK